MSNRTKNNPWASDPGFEPYDQITHSQDLEKVDVFNRLTDDTASIHIKGDLLKLAASDNPDVLAALREAGIESPRTRKPCHLSDGTVGEVFADANGIWHAVVTISGQELDFAHDDRDVVMMSAERYLEKNRGPHFKGLTEGQRLNCVRLAQNGDWQTAIGTYLYFVLGDQVTDMHPQEIASNPKWLPVMNDAVYFVWRNLTNGYLPSREAEASLAKFVGDRPLTMRLCDAWWLTYQDHLGQRRAVQAAPPENEHQPVPSPEQVQASLETLPDEQIERLWTKTLQHRGNAIRRFDEKMRGN